MKRRFIFAVFLVMFLVPIISAAQIELSKQSFDSGETLFATITGNFVDQPSLSDISFYRGHVKISVVYDMEKINDEFHIYALLQNKTQGNYSMKINNVRYYKGTSIVDTPIFANFTISNQTADFSIKPGFISTAGSFSVELQNLEENKITININTDSSLNPESSSLELKSGEKKFFTVDLVSPNAKEEVIFSTAKTIYTFPVFVESSTVVPESLEKEIKFETTSLDISLATSSEGKRVIYLENTGEADLEDIKLNVSSIIAPYISINPETVQSLDSGEKTKIELSIVSDVEEAIVEGLIKASVENISTSSVITLNFIKDFVPINNQTENLGEGTGSQTPSAKTCSEVGGEICSDSQECLDDTFLAQDGVCCLGSCQDVKKSSSGKWIGWLLILVAIVLVLWFYMSKYKRAAARKNGLSKFLKK